MSSLSNIPAVTVMPAAGKWAESDCVRAKQDMEAKAGDASGWRRIERNELITGALNTIAGFACGRTITKIIDPDGNWGSSRTDATGDAADDFAIGHVIVFCLYILLCLTVVGCGIYFLFGKVDDARERHDRVSQKLAAQQTLVARSSIGTQEDARALELGSRLSHTVRTSLLTRIINKWSSTQMFTVAVLLHHIYDWTPSRKDAPQNAWQALAWLTVLSMGLTIAFYELPVRVCARYQWEINLARLDRVVDVVANALAWLLAVFCMEALEITAAHHFMSKKNLKNVHYYSSAYHGFPVTLRTAVCLGTFFVTGMVLFSLQQIAKRADDKQRLCCRRCHPDDEYMWNATQSDREKRPRGNLRHDLATTLHFLGQHGHRFLKTTQKTFTNTSSIALQRLIMGLITFANYDVADDFVLKGKSASEAATQIWPHDPVPAPQPEPEMDDSSSGSGSWFTEENITETISPLFAACERALETHNATLLYNSIRSTRQGLSIDGKVVKHVDPEPEPLPEPEPEPEPLPEVDEATTVSVLKSSKWKYCDGESRELVCSVFEQLAEPKGGPTWVQHQCDSSVAVVCRKPDGPCDEPRFWHTGAMTKPFCHDMPLYGDSILLAIFAVFCSVVALWILLSGERSLRRRLSDAIRRTEATLAHTAERSLNAEPNPLISQGQTGERLQNQSMLSTKDHTNIKFVQTRYDYMAMLGEQQRSFCQWIVNKTWWDVTYLL